VVAVAHELRENPLIFEDPERYEAAATRLAEAIGGMSGAERLAWRDRVNALQDAGSVTGGDSGRTRAAMDEASAVGIGRLDNALLLDRQRPLGKINFGRRTLAETRATFVGSIDRINAVGNTTGGIRAEVDDLIAILFEFGYGVALGLASNPLSGSITDNHIAGELSLMNGISAGLDPREVTIAGRTGGALTTPVKGNGHLSLTGNRLQRLWALLPNGSVTDNALDETVPGYASLSLADNQLSASGHSLVAEVLTMTGNRLLNSGSGTLARLVCNRAALTGNVATPGIDSVITVVAPTMAAAANLVNINRA
jgi:hypothetical protein